MCVVYCVYEYMNIWRCTYYANEWVGESRETACNVGPSKEVERQWWYNLTI